MRLSEIMATALTKYAERQAVGERATELVRDPDSGRVSLRLLPRYDTVSYEDLWARVQSVASNWHRSVSAGDRVAVLGSASVDYVAIDLACVCLGAVSVHLQASATTTDLDTILDETEPRIVATSIDHVDLIRDLPHLESVQRVVVFNYHPEVDDQREHLTEARERLKRRNVGVEPLQEIITSGSGLPSASISAAPDDGDALSMLIYTSGSTGTPKGAMYTEWLASAMWGAGWSGLYSEVEAEAANDAEAINFCYMPMSHVSGHSSLKNALARGATTYFTARSDLSTIFEDLALVRPTELSLVPRVCEMLFHRYLRECDRRTGQSDAEVKEAIRRDLLGGRIAWAGCGSAPLSAELREFMESLLGLKLYDVYGSTEAAAISVDNRIMRPPVIDYRLEDVPELGYFRTDLPHPRGELLLTSTAMIPGYYRHPEATKETFTDDGFYRTGDIVEEHGPDHVVFVDRRKSTIKLSQGEFVMPAQLESTFATSPLVRQIFVHGNGEQSYLLAVVVPTPEALKNSHEDEGRLKVQLYESLRRLGTEAELKSYEVPRDFLIEREPFSQANGLLSDYNKLLRPRLIERYGPALEHLYSDIAAREAEMLQDLFRTGRDRPTLETIQWAVRVLLSNPGIEVSPTSRFSEVGGDSLSAVSLAELLGQIFQVRVPLDTLISPTADLRQLANYIDARRALPGTQVSFTSVHGTDPTVIHATDLTLDRFLPPPVAAPASSRPPRTVLLTGANGYLGRFLCLELLERLAPTGGKLLCLVRGHNAPHAWSRLEHAMSSGDDELLRRFTRLSDPVLEVVAGDVGLPRFGLDDGMWTRISEETDAIVHAAAMVNHVVPYDSLFEPNVLGTAEVIRLGLTGRIKPLTYVSTVGVGVDEDSDVRVAMPTRHLQDGYGEGYTTSKWASEVLLREAHETYDLPVTVVRPNMILAHSQYSGQLNMSDLFTRLIFSLLATGVAPDSFYRNDSGRPHYDGLPVDFTAGAIVTLTEQRTAGYRTFNLVNPHDDGVSLDTVVDWLKDAGHRIERIPCYADWLARFEAALRRLPEEQRKYSALPIIEAFTHPDMGVRGSAFPSARFQASVAAVPRITQALITKYAADLRPVLMNEG
jgi:fatty acid CoA ligase FadD9